MVGVSEATSSHGSGAARRLTAVVFAAITLLAMTLALGGTAQACPPGAKADSARSLSHAIKKAAALKASIVWVTSHAAKMPTTLGVCCGSSHSGGPACQGACSSCTVALAVTDIVAPFPAAGAAYAAFEPNALPPVKGPPEFRPPRRRA